MQVSNDDFVYFFILNTLLSTIGDTFITVSFDVFMLDSESSNYKRLTWFNFVFSTKNYRYIEYKRMALEGGTAEGLVGISKSKIPVQLENGKVLQPSSKR